MNVVVKASLVLALAMLAGCSSIRGGLALNRPVAWTPATYSETNQQLTSRSEALREAAPFVDQETDLRVSISSDKGPILPEGSAPTPNAGFTYVISADGDGLELDRGLYNRLLQSYASDRRSQIDKLCIAYFQSLDDMAGATRFAQNEINSIGDFAAVVMGITGSPAEHLAILAGAQALTNDSFDAVSAMMLLSPPPSVVFDLVKSRQRELAAAAWQNGFATIGEAELFVSQYATTCVPVGIRAIVTATIATRATEANPDIMSAGQQASLLLIRQALNQELQPADQLTSLSTDEAAFAVWYLGLPDCGTDLTVVACTVQRHIKESVSSGLWKALTTPVANPGTRARLVGSIQAVVDNATAIGTRKIELMGDYERAKVIAANEALALRAREAETQRDQAKTDLEALRKSSAGTAADLQAQIDELKARLAAPPAPVTPTDGSQTEVQTEATRPEGQ